MFGGSVFQLDAFDRQVRVEAFGEAKPRFAEQRVQLEPSARPALGRAEFAGWGGRSSCCCSFGFLYLLLYFFLGGRFRVFFSFFGWGGREVASCFPC